MDTNVLAASAQRINHFSSVLVTVTDFVSSFYLNACRQVRKEVYVHSAGPWTRLFIDAYIHTRAYARPAIFTSDGCVLSAAAAASLSRLQDPGSVGSKQAVSQGRALVELLHVLPVKAGGTCTSIASLNLHVDARVLRRVPSACVCVSLSLLFLLAPWRTSYRLNSAIKK